MTIDEAIEQIRSEAVAYELSYRHLGQLHYNITLLAAAERVVEEVERLREAYKTWAESTLVVGSHRSCDCVCCRRLAEAFCDDH